jgi:glycosyltransferase involved in cell wall biosynthesis
MKLAMLVHGYTPAVGGVEYLMQTVSEGLARRGHDVTVLTTDGYSGSLFIDPSQPRIMSRAQESINGVLVRRFRVVNALSPGLRVIQSVLYKLRCPGNDYVRALYQGPIVPGMLRTLWTMDADVITAASCPLLHMHYPFWLPRSRRPPIVLIGAIHTDHDWGYNRPSIFRVMRLAERCVAFTEFEKSWLVDRGVDPKRISVIGPGIDPRHFTSAAAGAFRSARGIEERAPLIVFLGRHGLHKGIETLIKAMPWIWLTHPSAHLVIAGARTTYTPRLQQLANETPWSPQGRIIFDMDLTEAAKAELLSDATVFVSPSAYESFGITFLEAWAAGVPVIGGRSEATEGVITDGQDGLLVRYGDAAALTATIRRLLEDPTLRTNLAASGRRKLLERYTTEEIVDQYDALYSSIA